MEKEFNIKKAVDYYHKIKGQFAFQHVKSNYETEKLLLKNNRFLKLEFLYSHPLNTMHYTYLVMFYCNAIKSEDVSDDKVNDFIINLKNKIKQWHIYK